MRRAEVQVSVDGVTLEAELCVPPAPTGLVLFAHGSGRHSPRNGFVAWTLQCAGLGTLLVDLLTRQEELDDTADAHFRFDVSMLARRLTAAALSGLVRGRELSLVETRPARRSARLGRR